MEAMFVNVSGQNKQSIQKTLYRCSLPGFGSFVQAVSEEKIFRNLPIRNKNYPWQPCLLTDRNEMSNLNRGPFIDASCQVSVHLAKQFQRKKFKCEKLTRQRRQVMAKGDMTFGSFGQAVSEENIFRNLTIRNKKYWLL